MKQKVMKVGNSVVVTVPADFIRKAGIRVGDQVEVRPDIKKGKVTYKFSGIQQLSLTEIFTPHKRRGGGSGAKKKSNP